jgi:Methyltransferase domain
VDPAGGMIAAARAAAGDDRLRWVKGTAEELPFAEGSFDVGGRRHKARTKRRAGRLLARAGFQAVQWHDVEAVVIRAVTAARG